MRLRATYLLFPGLLALAGCTVTESFLVPHPSKPTSGVCQVLVTWIPHVVFTPDPTHGGRPTPGLAGRIYLYGEKIEAPLLGDGSAVIDLYQCALDSETETGPPLEEWRIDKDTLKRLQRQDAVGWGYTLFLPWATYRPDITQVRLRVCYQPAEGTPLYAESARLTLDNGGFGQPVGNHHAR